MKKVTKKATENGVKTLIFIGVGCFILYMFDLFRVYDVDNQSWGVIGLLSIAAAVQWGVIAAVLNANSDEIGERVSMTKKKWMLTFVPTAAMAAVLGILYGSLGEKVTFFRAEAGNVFASLGIVLLGVGVCYLLDYAYISATKKNQVQTTTVKIVKKERKEKKAKAESERSEKKEKAERGGAIFPDLLSIDAEYRRTPYAAKASAEVTLKGLCDGFNAYLESHGMYYTAETIRAFVSGLACSRFMILEGLSGTGKTSLPKYFAEYTGAAICFTSVQASWKDRSDILGYYNDFTGSFKETPFLRALYRANYETDEIGLMVLDEMNLSRIEYYFADFLSVLELDAEQWQIELMPVSTAGELPEKLEGCAVRIPENVWFIGTANKDDSTFTVTDKVYDRAVVIEFSQRNEAHALTRKTEPIHLGSGKLQALYASALENPNYGLTRSDYEKFSRLAQFVLEAFDVNFGNRIQNQIVKFVPVYAACGGTKEKALDLMFARKVLRKLEGRYDDSVKPNLVKLEKLVTETYGKAEFSATLEVIARLKRKLF